MAHQGPTEHHGSVAHRGSVAHQGRHARDGHAARDVVLAWHAALNAGDVARLVGLSCDDVEVGGPRGAGRGKELLRAWFGRAGLRLDPLRLLERGATVVAEQDATWSTDARPRRLASVFRVRDAKIGSVLRYPDLATALAAAGLPPSSLQPHAAEARPGASPEASPGARPESRAEA